MANASAVKKPTPSTVKKTAKVLQTFANWQGTTPTTATVTVSTITDFIKDKIRKSITNFNAGHGHTYCLASAREGDIPCFKRIVDSLRTSTGSQLDLDGDDQGSGINVGGGGSMGVDAAGVGEITKPDWVNLQSKLKLLLRCNNFYFCNF